MEVTFRKKEENIVITSESGAVWFDSSLEANYFTDKQLEQLTRIIALALMDHEEDPHYGKIEE